MGYELVITEFDVNDQMAPSNLAQRDQLIAGFARDYLDLMFSYPQLKDVLAWGMCDAHSWLQDFKPLRADGLAKRPCPYGADYKAKPLRDAMAQAFASAAPR